VEAIDTARYLVNMSPSLVLFDVTLNEVCLGKRPSVSHLKVFGCDAFVHVPKEKRSKLDKKAIKCIFIGYKEGMKGYKLWDPTSRRTMYSRDVVFRELGSKSRPKEVVQTKKNSDMVRFELRSKEYDSDKSTEYEEEVEQITLVIRRLEREIKPVERYSPPELCSAFVLIAIKNQPKSIDEVVDSTEGKL
jgi:hypothetical protein